MNNLKNKVVIMTVFLILVVLFGCKSNDETTNQDINNGSDTKNVDTSTSSSDDENRSDSGGDLNIALSAQPAHLDTQLTTNQVIREVSRNIYETLVALDEEYHVQPMLAESIDQSDDYEKYTFYLRKGVKFHNGDEMTAEDVVASMNRWKSLYPNAQAMLGDSEFEKVDDYTVEINLSQSYSDFLVSIAGAKQIPVIMPADIAETSGKDILEEYIGTGPFKFLEWKQDQYLQLTKYEEYESVDFESSGMAGKKEALVENVYYHFVTDSSTRLAGIQTGEYHIAEKLSYDDYDMVESDQNLNPLVDHYASATLVFNKKEGIFTDVNMRKAVNAALDIEQILMGAFSNDIFYDMTSSYIYEKQIDWFSEEGKEFYNQTDPKLVQDYLEEADYNGEPIKIVTTRDYEYMYNISVVLQQQLEEAGMTVDLQVFDWASLDAVQEEPEKWDIANINFTPVTSPIDLLYFSTTWRGWNDDEEILDLLDQIAKSSSKEEKKGLWDKTQARSWDYLPIIKLGDFNDFIASSSSVEGLSLFQGLILWNTKVIE
ncbi:ABC transporter substrate-binding protein [Ornithinibacillus sp. 4-3]|uniref:ABC transporter substrate-binding protein n=1 Tax=Ornithinibacillus sp. 4-3 TaxID=3231488 RepID=A0AB39HJ74_9BACI